MKSSPYTLSVIVPCYNYGNFVSIALDSVLSQAGDRVQVIAVDDCSTDNSREVIASYGSAITAVFHEKNLGHGGGFNSGFSVATGDFILFLDADDFLLPGAVETILGALEPGTDVYHFRLRLADGDGELGDLFPPEQKSLAQGDISEKLRFRGRYDATVTSGLVYSRRVLQKTLPIDTENQAFRNSGDGYLCACAPLYGPSKTCETAIAAYRIHGGNHSLFTRDLVKRARWRVLHDLARYQTIREHAARLGLPVADNLGERDEAHLEQRITLDLNSEEDRDPAWGRGRLAICGLKSLDRSGAFKGRLLQMAWWSVLGFAPRGVARTLLNWKQNAASRPQFVKDFALFLRASLGLTLK